MPHVRKVSLILNLFIVKIFQTTELKEKHHKINFLAQKLHKFRHEGNGDIVIAVSCSCIYLSISIIARYKTTQIQSNSVNSS